MAIALAQSKTGTWKTGSPSSGTEQPTSNITTGNLQILTIHLDSTRTVSTVTDSAGNTWTRGPNKVQGTMTAASVEMWYTIITAGGGTRPTITITNSGTSNFGCFLYEFSGIDTTTPFDISATNGGTSTTSLSTGTTATTAQANELVFSATQTRDGINTSFTCTSGNGNTANIVSNFIRPTIGYMTVSATGTQSDTFTTSTTQSVYAAVIATFKEASGGATTSTSSTSSSISTSSTSSSTSTSSSISTSSTSQSSSTSTSTSTSSTSTSVSTSTSSTSSSTSTSISTSSTSTSVSTSTTTVPTITTSTSSTSSSTSSTSTSLSTSTTILAHGFIPKVRVGQLLSPVVIKRFKLRVK